MLGRIRLVQLLLLAWLVLPVAAAAPPEERLLVLAAASLTNALNDIGLAYTRASGQPVKFSFAASSALARQLEAGAHADLFISADTDWMDYLQRRSLIDSSTRRDIAGGQLVLIAPATSKVQLRIGPGFGLASALGSGRLAMADPDSVPAGRYGREALTSLRVWPGVAHRVARAENVRAALELVARGEAPLGIVYRTDALVETRVRIVDAFPPGSHAPIVYPAAMTSVAGAGARRFLDYLSSSAAQNILRQYGFVAVQPAPTGS